MVDGAADVKATRPLRHTLAETLRGRITAGEWAPGERLPSEPELARREAVSRSSVRSAIDILEEEGRVSRRQGSGTYVTHRPVLPRDLGRNFDVTSLIASTGREPGTAQEWCAIVPAPEHVAVALAMDREAPVTALQRVHTGDGTRVVDAAYWCRSEDLDPDELRTAGAGSIYAALAACGKAVHHAVARLSPGNADADVAGRLGVARGALLLTIDQADSTVDGTTVLVSRVHHLADAFSFSLLRHGPGLEGES